MRFYIFNFYDMKKIVNIFNYIFSVYNFKGKDNGLHFFIKTVLSIVLVGIVWFLSAFVFSMIGSITGNVMFWIYGWIAITFFHTFYILLSSASRRFRDMWQPQNSLIMYIISFFFFWLGIIYWIYLCFAKSKKVDNI